MFCYAALLCLHQCLPSCILFSFLIFSSISACTPQVSLPLTDMHLCSLLLLSFSSCTSCFYTHASLTTIACSVCVAPHIYPFGPMHRWRLLTYPKGSPRALHLFSALHDTSCQHLSSSSQQLFIFPGNYAHAFIINVHYPKIP